MTKDSIKHFITFLKENNAYSAYRYNISREKDKLRYLTNTFQKTEEYLIFHSFVWSSTKEGSIYWSDLYNKWIKIC